MSAFLGPIHYWLFNKIQLQQGIVDEIYALGNQQGLSLQEECDAQFGRLENKPLEEMIDLSNIHGWLQEHVTQVEYKYAYSVTKLLAKTPAALDILKEILNQKGRELGLTVKANNPDAPQLFQIVSDNLLDGMPCDHANSVVSKEENEIIWKRNLCVHENYWVSVDGNISIYYELRDAWLEGLVEECGFTFHKLDSTTYSIKK